MHRRRARPTIRLLREDLEAGWGSPAPQRSLSEGDLDALHPLAELPHPIIAKAAETFGDDPDQDNPVGPIASCTQLPLWEIKVSQWRGGVWWDAEAGVHWLVVAGIAKGNHTDRDDFYERVKREDRNGDPHLWLPTSEDICLLKRETTSRLLTNWEIGVQQRVLNELREIHTGGSTRSTVSHPIPDQGKLATITIEVTPIREDDYESDDIFVEITPESRFAGSNLLWQLTTRVLISLNPPEQTWDRVGDTFSNIAEPGAWTERVRELEVLTAQSVLAESKPGETAHYAHKPDLAESTVNGTAVRAICGVFFVPTQDHEALPICPTCADRWEQLPG